MNDGDVYRSNESDVDMEGIRGDGYMLRSKGVKPHVFKLLTCSLCLIIVVVYLYIWREHELNNVNIIDYLVDGFVSNNSTM